MTLILAGWIDRTILVAADRRVTVITGDVQTHGDGDKLIELGTCVVASFGEGPRGPRIPEFIRETPSSLVFPEEIATSLSSRLGAYPDAGELGLMVVGFNKHAQPELWEVRPPSLPVLATSNPGCFIARGVFPHFDEATRGDSVASMGRIMCGILQQTAALCARVGPPFEIAHIKRGTAPDIRRCTS